MTEDIILRHSARKMDFLRQFMPQDYVHRAAHTILSAKRGRCAVVTGFCVDSHPETDGPVGSFFLIKAFEKLGFSPFVVTDCATDLFDKIEQSRDLSDITLAISVERCGKCADGFYRNMHGKDISDFTEPFDGIFSLPIPTVCFGDGGNEIGMGNLKEHITWLEPCVTKCDALVISTVSNWGVWGVLSLLKMLPENDELLNYYHKINSLGAVDGVTGKPTPTSDGFDFNTESEILNDLRTAAGEVSHICI